MLRVRCGIVLLLLLGACRGPLLVKSEVDCTRTGAPAWACGDQVDLAVRATNIADAAAVVWGGQPYDLDGWTITFIGGYVDGHPFTTGRETHIPILDFVTGGDIKVDVYWQPVCPEIGALAHEVGHAIIGDDGHTDPRWTDPKFDNQIRQAMMKLVEFKSTCWWTLLRSPLRII